MKGTDSRLYPSRLLFYFFTNTIKSAYTVFVYVWIRYAYNFIGSRRKRRTEPHRRFCGILRTACELAMPFVHTLVPCLYGLRPVTINDINVKIYTVYTVAKIQIKSLCNWRSYRKNRKSAHSLHTNTRLPYKNKEKAQVENRQAPFLSHSFAKVDNRVSSKRRKNIYTGIVPKSVQNTR